MYNIMIHGFSYTTNVIFEVVTLIIIIQSPRMWWYYIVGKYLCVQMYNEFYKLIK